MNAAAPASGARSTGQMMVDRTAVYDKTFKRQPRAGRPRKNHKHKQFWLR